MKRAAGFTLIELVIVIVILGILGAVAAPRFLNLQDEAYESNIKSLRSNIQSAMTLANTKAVLEGKDNAGTWTGTGEFADVAFVYGYPKASADGILDSLQGLDAGAEGADSAVSENALTYAIATADGDTTLTLKPSQRYAASCQVVYTQAKDGIPAKVDMDTSGC
ncbi:type II secretion system protein [Oceanimonas sp. MB9]|uniref:type II secretion system protein n=1 Tax=Oceanimonas sp. MB9 TaxID=2588453 RepID=UPI0013F676A8|nr:type II secretion system protein [Oceanimonas sp. MB9]